MNIKTETSIAAVLLLAYFLWLGCAMVPSASENLRLVEVFNVDAGTHVRLLRAAISNHSFKIDFAPYGHLPFNLALIPLLTLENFSPASDQRLVIALRLVSWASAIGAVFTTFLLSRRFFGSAIAWGAAVLTCVVSTEFIHWSVHSHPDIPQVLFLMISLFFCCELARTDSLRSLVLSSIAAGLAFACKYSGLFLLPVIWLVVLSHTSQRREVLPRRVDLERFAVALRSLIAVFGLSLIAAGLSATREFANLHLSTDGSVDSHNLEFLGRLRGVLLLAGSCALVVSGIPRMWRYVATIQKLPGLLFRMTVSLASFGGAFLLASPFSLTKLNFLRGLVNESRHVSFGHVVKEGGGLAKWIEALLSSEVLGSVPCALAALAAIAAGIRAIKTRGSSPGFSGWASEVMRRPEVILSLWVFCYLTFLVLRVRMIAPRYLLPVVPASAILAAWSCVYLISVSRRVKNPLIHYMSVASLAILLSFFLVQSFNEVSDYRSNSMDRVSNSASVAAGNWLLSEYSTDSKVYGDYYSYVPPAFRDARMTWAGTEREIREFAPDIVIVNQRVASRFADPRLAGIYRGGREAYLEHFEYYQSFSQGRLDYRLVLELGDIAVFMRTEYGN